SRDSRRRIRTFSDAGSSVGGQLQAEVPLKNPFRKAETRLKAVPRSTPWSLCPAATSIDTTSSRSAGESEMPLLRALERAVFPSRVAVYAPARHSAALRADEVPSASWFACCTDDDHSAASRTPDAKSPMSSCARAMVARSYAIVLFDGQYTTESTRTPPSVLPSHAGALASYATTVGGAEPQ